MLYSRGAPMESLGIPTRDGTPVETDPREIWQAFADNAHLFRGTPTGAWLDHELHDVFGVKVRLDGDTAQSVYDQIAERLASPEFRPRGLFERFNIEVLATTDAASDSLEHHRAHPASGWRGRVIPTFRPDAVFRIATPEWASELECLAQVAARRSPTTRRSSKRSRKARAFSNRSARRRPTMRSSSRGRRGCRRRGASAIFICARCAARRRSSDQRRFEAHMLDGDGAHVRRGRAGHAAPSGRASQSQPSRVRPFRPGQAARDIPVATEYTRNLAALLNAYGNDERFSLRAVHARRIHLRARARAARRSLSGAPTRPAVVVPRFDRRA